MKTTANEDNDFGQTIVDLINILKESSIYHFMSISPIIENYFKGKASFEYDFIKRLSEMLINDTQLKRLADDAVYKTGIDNFYTRWFNGVHLTYKYFSETRQIDKDDTINLILFTALFYYSFDKVSMNVIYYFETMCKSILGKTENNLYTLILDNIRYELLNKSIYVEIMLDYTEAKP